MNTPKNNTDKIILLNIVRKHLKSFLLVALLGAIASAIFSSPWFIPTQYKSETVIYVPLTKISEQLIFTGYRFANDKETDEFIQILQSIELVDSLDIIFNLGSRYQLDQSDPLYTERLREAVGKKITVQKTRYSSISVSVKDEDPVLAAGMANEIVRLGDVIKEKLYKENNALAFDFAQSFYDEKVIELNQMKEFLIKEEYADKSLAIEQLNSRLKTSNQKIKRLNQQIETIRNSSGSFKPDQQNAELTNQKFRLINLIASDSGRMQTYKETLPETDTLYLKAKAAFQARKEELRVVNIQLKKITTYSNSFELAHNELNLERDIQAHLERELALIEAEHNPQFANVEVEKTKIQLNLELEELIERKSYFEKTRQHLNNIVPKVYVINRAIPSQLNTFPNRKLIIITSVCILLILTLISYVGYYMLKREG